MSVSWRTQGIYLGSLKTTDNLRDFYLIGLECSLVDASEQPELRATGTEEKLRGISSKCFTLEKTCFLIHNSLGPQEVISSCSFKTVE